MRNIKSKKGQVAEAVATLITLSIAIVIGITLVAELESSSIGDCVENTSTVGNNSVLSRNNENESTIFSLSSILSRDGNLTIGYENSTGLQSNITVNGNSVGTLTGGASAGVQQSFNVPHNYLTASTNVTVETDALTNITAMNLSYYRLISCDYTVDAYEAMTDSSDMAYTGFSIAPVVLLIFAAVAVIAAIMALRRTA